MTNTTSSGNGAGIDGANNDNINVLRSNVYKNGKKESNMPLKLRDLLKKESSLWNIQIMKKTKENVANYGLC